MAAWTSNSIRFYFDHDGLYRFMRVEERGEGTRGVPLVLSLLSRARSSPAYIGIGTLGLSHSYVSSKSGTKRKRKRVCGDWFKQKVVREDIRERERERGRLSHHVKI